MCTSFNASCKKSNELSHPSVPHPTVGSLAPADFSTQKWHRILAFRSSAVQSEVTELHNHIEDIALDERKSHEIIWNQMKLYEITWNHYYEQRVIAYVLWTDCEWGATCGTDPAPYPSVPQISPILFVALARDLLLYKKLRGPYRGQWMHLDEFVHFHYDEGEDSSCVSSASMRQGRI